MGKLNKDNNGFGGVELFLVIVIVVLLGVVGWFVYKNHHKTVTSTQATTSTKNSITTTNLYSGWNSYTLKYEKLSFKYPTSWIPTDTSANGVDNVTFTSSDTFTFSIEDADVPGGDPIQLVSTKPISVDFVGAKDYIVFSNPSTPAPNVSTQPNIANGAFLLTDPNDYLSYPVDKNVVNVYNSNFGAAGSHLFIFMTYTNSSTHILTISQASTDKEYLNAKLAIESMAY